MYSRIERKDAEWQAVRYAIDMIDIAWSYDHVDSAEYPESYAASKAAMQKHRDVLIKLQDDILKTVRALKELDS